MKIIIPLILAVVGKLAADELKAWLPRLATLLKDRAVRRLPQVYRARYDEEWASSLLEVPGDLSKTFFALSLLCGASSIGADEKISSWTRSVLRRAVDAAGASFAILLFFPVIISCAILIWIGSVIWESSGGPIFFRQRRVGRDGKEFTLYKFRTTYDDTLMTVTGEPRFTPVGALMRRYDLDELPQFWNVLRGDMSLVGPRPKLPHHVQFHMPCRPGLTGAAAQAFRKEAELLSLIPDDEVEAFYETFVKPAQAKLDLEYMNTATLATDLKLLWRAAVGCIVCNDNIDRHEAIQAIVPPSGPQKGAASHLPE